MTAIINIYKDLFMSMTGDDYDSGMAWHANPFN